MTSKVTYHPNYAHDLPSWDDILKNIEYNVYHNNPNTKIMENLGFVTTDNSKIESIESLRKQIHSLKPEEPICTAHVYISMLTTSKTFGWHNDDTEVYFIQALGQTKWQIEENNEIIEHILNPGDMIFVPKGLRHNTIPLTARVGISIGFT